MRNALNALRPSRHDSPNDPLRGHSDYVAFEGPKHCVDSFCEFYCSTILERPAGFEPAYTSFVAKAIIPLWHGRMNLVGELRIELRPRAPKARMPCHYTIPRLVPAQRVERCSLRFQRSVSTAHTRLAKSGGPSRLCPDHLRIASAALCLNEL